MRNRDVRRSLEKPVNATSDSVHELGLSQSKCMHVHMNSSRSNIRRERRHAFFIEVHFDNIVRFSSKDSRRRDEIASKYKIE